MQLPLDRGQLNEEVVEELRDGGHKPSYTNQLAN